MKLPEFFKPILWSYDFPTIDSEKNKKVIIVNTINYGDLEHWHWLMQYYGKEAVRDVLEQIPSSEMRPRALRLATAIFSIKNFNHAPRGIN